MMKTAFSSGASPLYTSATVAKPSLSRATCTGVDSEDSTSIVDEEICSIEDDEAEIGSIDDEISSGSQSPEEETGMASDDNAAEDHSGESCADDPPNIPQESGDSRPDEHDSIFDISDCRPEE
jgi:hypothetical protein